MHPKAFVCHASEDKTPFVIPFATALRSQKGIDAWVDKWEMLPGDSLVDKIFEEGLKEAKAIIIVLSNNSVNKPWVREEINAAFVNRIEKGTKLIPIVIDNCQVPECLKSTLWELVQDINNFQSSLDRVANKILGYTDKPSLATPAQYTADIINNIGGLNKLDNIVFKKIGNYALKNSEGLGEPLFIEKIFVENDQFIIPKSDLLDSLKILEEEFYINLSLVLSNEFGGINHMQLTTYGFQAYVEHYLQDYNSFVEKVIISIVNEGKMDNHEIIKSTQISPFLVNSILDILESNSLIKLSKLMGYFSRIYQVSPSLKRMLN
ncbi:MAG TPA: molecular chaperone Tir [Alphaproteobacteria bacterium]|nr:molecular chaperone Tir [Alphaproteobacteria bacterium]